MLEWIARYWLEVLFSCITGFLFFCIKKLYDNQKSSEQRQKLMQEANNKGTEALLRDRLFAAYNHYYERGWITVHGLESVNRMYEAYHNLGGNGTVSRLVEQLRELPVRDKAAVMAEQIKEEKE